MAAGPCQNPPDGPALDKSLAQMEAATRPRAFMLLWSDSTPVINFTVFTFERGQWLAVNDKY